MNHRKLLLPSLLALPLFLAACHEAPAPVPQPSPPILQGKQLRFPAGHPQIAQIGTTSAAPVHAIAVDLPARLVWNEDRTQRLYPAFAGRIARIVADVGQPVRQGSPLAELASPEFGAAQAEAVKAEVDLRLKQKALARQRELFDAGVVAKKEFEQAQADAESAAAETQRARARTSLYGARGDAVNQRLMLVSGIPGVVVERNVTPGQELRPDQMGSGTPPIFVVSDPTSLWVQIDARESEAGTLRPGATFQLVASALPGETFTGTVAAASDFIDPASRTIKVRGVVANPDRKLKAEMLATARVQRTPGSGVMIPTQALSMRDGKHFVVVQVQPGVFEEREVNVGQQGAREVLVTAGLEVGEPVVTENLLLLLREYRGAQEASVTRPAVKPGAHTGNEQDVARAGGTR